MLSKLFEQFTDRSKDARSLAGKMPAAADVEIMQGSGGEADAARADAAAQGAHEPAADPLASMYAYEDPMAMTPHGAEPAPAAAHSPVPVRDDLPPLANPIEKGLLEEEIIEMMRTCYDPEIPVNIYDMGLIYEIDIHNDRSVDVKMTLTSPGCPVAGTLPGEVERKVAQTEGVRSAKVELVWEPTWTMEFMSEDAKLELGFF